MVKLSGLQAAEEIHEQDMQDPEYRREYERTGLATDIAVKVIQYRTDHGLSQTALGRKLGISQPNVARLQAGEHLPSVETLARLASYSVLDFSGPQPGVTDSRAGMPPPGGHVRRDCGSPAVRPSGHQIFEVLQMSGYHGAMSTIEVSFSRLLQQPKDTVARLEQSPRRRIRLDRRDGEDLILESASRAEAEDEALSMASRLFVSLVQNDAGARALLLSLPDVFPWVRFLPKGDVQAFLVELVETIRACVSLNNVAALAPVIAAWQGTAEIYSDPELLKAAAAPLDGNMEVRLPRLAAEAATLPVPPRRRVGGA
jgi:transcriptional regulator with XRE-family HTH domain